MLAQLQTLRLIVRADALAMESPLLAGGTMICLDRLAFRTDVDQSDSQWQ
jgi:hypothetical protein